MSKDNQHSTYYYSAMQKCGIPKHCQDSLLYYIVNRRPAGSFLTAVLENDFVNAVRCADDINKHAFRAYARFLKWEAPHECWGSREKVKAWLNPKKKENNDG